MSRHILDPATTRGRFGRLVHYLGLERRERMHGPHRAVDVLSRQPRGGRSVGQVRSYMRQDRLSEAGHRT